jgi:predicted nucleotidyltransferase
MPTSQKRRTSRARQRFASGRFVLRIGPTLHETLRAAAADSGLSLNDYCIRQLAAPVAACDVPDAAAAVSRASSLFGLDVIGVVAFGSWIRGDAATSSDIDLLIVLERRVALTRDLYRRWDEASAPRFERLVEPHFVHLPEAKMVTGGVWAEAALDGVVLFERHLQVSRQLALLRRHILSGRLIRRVAHGQPYWAEVAS